jgi:hypothetical protein
MVSPDWCYRRPTKTNLKRAFSKGLREEREALRDRSFFKHAYMAGGKPTSGDFHASAALACDTHRRPVPAGDGGPGNPGDHNGRAELVIDIHSMMAGGKPVGSDFHANSVPTDDTGQSVVSGTTSSGQTPRFWRPVLVGDGPPTGVGSGNGRTVALSQRGREYRVAST